MNKELQQGTVEWLELRKRKIGASDAPVIMEVSPWKTPYQLWQEKLGLKVQQVSQAMRIGSESEEEARKCFESKTNLIMIPTVVFHPANEWMMASLDGMDIDRRYIVEIKRANKEDHKLAIKGKIPDHYMPQVQHQLEVTGLDMAYYFSFDGHDGVIVEVPRNTKYIKTLVEAELEFYSNIETFTPPKISIRDYRVRDDEEFVIRAQEYTETLKQYKRIKKSLDELEEGLIAMCDDQSTMCDYLRITKVYRSGSIEYSKIPELSGIDLDKYRKNSSPYWRFSDKNK